MGDPRDGLARGWVGTIPRARVVRGAGQGSFRASGDLPALPVRTHRRSMGTLPMPGSRCLGTWGFLVLQDPVKIPGSLRQAHPLAASLQLENSVMARIAGVNLPAKKHAWVGLQSIFGIGSTRSKQV